MKSNLWQVQDRVGVNPGSAAGLGTRERGITLDTFFNGALIFFAMAFFTAEAAQGMVQSGFELAAVTRVVQADGGRKVGTHTAREPGNVWVKDSQQVDSRVYPANSAA